MELTLSPIYLTENKGKGIKPEKPEKKPYSNYQEYQLSVPDAWHSGSAVTPEAPGFITKTVYSFYKVTEAQGFDRAMHALNIHDLWYVRLIKQVLLDAPFTLYSGGVVHETAGHGWRAKEIGCEQKYLFNPFLAEFGQREDVECPIESMTPLNSLIGTVEGPASTQNASKWAHRDMLVNGGDHIKAYWYLDTKLDITNYTMLWNNPTWTIIMSKFDDAYRGGDTRGDVAGFWYDSQDLRYQELLDKGWLPEEIHEKGLFKGPGFSYWNIYIGALWNLIDPTAVYMAIQLVKYVFLGEDKFEMPGFIPRTNYYMTPNGPLYQLAVPFRIGPAVMEAGMETTVNTEGLEQSGGGWLKLHNLKWQPAKYARFDFGAELHVFNRRGKWGVLAEGSLMYSPIDQIGIGGSVGYKSENVYLPGRPYEDSLLYSIDVAVRF
ncbi:MAG: hypothetical protein KKH83_04255 [Candidatus Margulisbacteria bacterium]|nr:hypothetical protein [Candidatus Margulisiibacteriota bacterium]